MTIVKSPLMTLIIALVSGFAVKGFVSDSFESLVSNYCQIPIESRHLVRNFINSSIYPNKVMVECEDEQKETNVSKR